MRTWGGQASVSRAAAPHAGDGIQPGLMEAVLDRDGRGNLIRKAGIMRIVLAGGEVRPGDSIRVELPPTPRKPLEPV